MTNNETLGYLRVVRDGEDCTLSKCEPEDYVLYDGDLEYVDSEWLRKASYREAHDHLVTPVRLEPCEPTALNKERLLKVYKKLTAPLMSSGRESWYEDTDQGEYISALEQIEEVIENMPACEPPAWRTDVENAPEDLVVQCIERSGEVSDLMLDGGEWVDVYGDIVPEPICWSLRYSTELPEDE